MVESNKPSAFFFFSCNSLIVKKEEITNIHTYNTELQHG